MHMVIVLKKHNGPCKLLAADCLSSLDVNLNFNRSGRQELLEDRYRDKVAIRPRRPPIN